MKLDNFKQKLTEAKEKITKFQAGGVLGNNSDFSMRMAARLAQSYRTNPNAKFKPNYFLDNIYHQTYQPNTQLHNPSITVSKANPGLSSEGMIVSDQASKKTYPFTNQFLDQTMTPPVPSPSRPELPGFKNQLGASTPKKGLMAKK